MPSANVVSFPTRATLPAAQHATAPALATRPIQPSRREYTLADVARLTGLSHASHKVLIATLRKLAEQAAMPLPKTPRIHAGKLCTGAAMIGMRSRWDALRFDDWLDDRTGPYGGGSGGAASAGATLPPVTASVREDMAARAATLAQLGNRRKRA